MKRFLAACSAALLICSLLFVPAERAFAQDTLEISTREEWQALAENCVLDSYSKGLKVVLTADLDLSGCDPVMIPLWQGTFDGQGHTLRGLSVSGDGAYTGLFRRILPKGKVKNLNVSGTVEPGGSAETVGGLAGQNEGLIENCRFDGRVAGARSIGLLAGLNDAGGRLVNCSAAGYAGGQHRIGGIAGENRGTIRGCVNEAEINTVYQVTDRTEYVISVLNEEEILDITDIGGIAGLCSGRVMNCTNRGAVGYSRTGYNVGGIVGRLCGHAADCVNEGKVCGRKDTGGIVGQMEPDGAWSYSTAALDELDGRLDELKASIDTACENADGSQSALSEALESLRESFDNAVREADTLSQESEKWINGNLSSVNQLSSRLHSLISGFAPIAAQFAAFSSGLSQTLRVYEDMTEPLKAAISEASAGAEDLKNSLDDISAAFALARTALDKVDAAFAALEEAAGNIKEEQEAFITLADAFSDLADCFASLAGDLSRVSLGPLPEEGTEDPVGEYQQLIYTFLQDLLQVFQDNSPALKAAFEQISSSFTGLASALDRQTLEENISLIEEAIGDLRDAFSGIGPVLTSLESAAGDLKSSLTHLQNAGEKGKEIIDSSKSMCETLRGALGNLSSAMTDTASLLTEWSEGGSVQFQQITAAQSESAHRLFLDLLDFSHQLEIVNTAFSEVSLAKDLQDISDKLFSVSDFLMGLLYDTQADEEAVIRTRDVSAYSDESRTTGVVDRCRNFGRIEAEINTGGIIGSIALEISYDPEDELPIRELVGGAEYLIFAVLRSCENYGDVTALRTAAGGIAGRMDYGAVLAGISAGIIRAEDGYAGGIAGRSAGLIEEAMARVNLEGKNYTGGIAGLGHDIRGCLVLPHFESGTEYQGAVAGDADGELLNNFYAESAAGGVNGFSFRGQCEPVSFEELLEKGSGSTLFADVILRFEAEGELIEERSVPFGGSAGALPQVPDKDGLVWHWEDFERDHIYYSRTVSGKYQRPAAVLSDGQTPPIILVEGSFSDEDRLTVLPLSGEALQKKAASLLAEEKPVQGAYQVLVPGYSGDLTVHVKAAGNGKLYILQEDGPVETAAARDGSYLVFSAENGASFLILEEETPLIWPYLAGGGALLLGLIGWSLIRRKKKQAT
ncbi:MAG: methyl-accepting chemotaxis protein [Lachnospiraceae bacterium]|nr:methyl-accepting chemotaxis protein [Lachnospiraceae bacterium]